MSPLSLPGSHPLIRDARRASGFRGWRINMQFQTHGIKTAQGLEKAWYMISTLSDGRKCITVCAQEYRRFSTDIRAAFAVENATDAMTDYFEKDSFRVFPDHPLFHDVAAGFRKMLDYRLKVSRHKEYSRQTLEDLNRLSSAARR